MSKGIVKKVVWSPIPNSSQAIAIDTRCHHTLYYGTRGPGKTITQLMRFRIRVGIGYGSFWRGVIFDREFKNLSDLVAQSKRFFLAFNDGAKFFASASEYKWVFPTGEELLFRHAKQASDYDNFHGHEYAFLGWNELTKHPTSELYDLMMSTNRSSFVPEIHTPHTVDKRGVKIYKTPSGKPLPRIPLEVFSTTNPSGAGHNWVRKRFIDVAEPGEVVEQEVEVFSPVEEKNIKIKKTQVAIFGTYKENIYLDPSYIAGLDILCKNNPNLKKAWLLGSWDFVSGGAIDDLWNSKVHIIERFKIPKDWLVDRSFDWGSSHPFSVGWWAISNGEEITVDGKKVHYPAGTLFQIDEWYGTESVGTNKGLKLSAVDIASGILEKEKDLTEKGWINSEVLSGPADNQIRDVREHDVETIEQKMAKVGVHWQQSDKSPGSRKIGLQLFRDRLEASLRKEGQGIYFFRNCKASLEIVPGLPRDENKIDDIDTTSEDHVYDMIRYRILKSANRFVGEIDVLFSR